MLYGDVIALVGVALIGFGLIATWMRNGRSQARRQGSLETDVKHIKETLDDENTGLGAIKKSVDDQRLHCAAVSSAFGERIKALEGKRKKS